MDINIKDLTKEQREDLKKQLDGYEEKSKTIWDMKDGDSYYYIDEYCNVDEIEYNGDDDNNLIAVGNGFLTREKAEKELEKRKAIVRINKRINELNDGWIPDLEDYGEYNIYYNNNLYAKCYGWDFTTYRKESHAIKYMQTEEIVKEIIRECKNDLDIIFDIK